MLDEVVDERADAARGAQLIEREKPEVAAVRGLHRTDAMEARVAVALGASEEVHP